MKKLTLLLPIFLGSLVFAPSAYAHCPLCVAGAGVGLAVSRYLGIDDSISGIWIAAFLGATALWTSGYIKKKYLPLQDALIYLSFFALTIWSFYKFNLVTIHAGIIMGVPKVIFGMIFGGVLFYIVEVINQLIRQIKGRVLFPYQPVVFSLSTMFLASVADYIFINYYI